MSTTDTAKESAPPRPAAARRMVVPQPKVLQEPAPEPYRPTRIMTRGGPKWKGVQERPRVVREPLHATEPATGDDTPTTKVDTKVDGTKVDGTKVDGTKVDSKVDGTKVDGTKVDSKVDGTKVDGTKVDGTKVDTKVEARR